MLNSRVGLVIVSIAAWAAVGSATLSAQDTWPNRSVTMIVPFPPGGSTDVIGRVVGEGLRQVLGQPVVIDNRGGAGGSLGTAAIAKAAPDGHTIGMGTASTLAINPAVYSNLIYDVTKDLAAITNIAAVPNVMTVHPALPAKSVAELIALAKAEPGKLSYASAGNGSVSHLMGEQFKLATGTNLVHVPYRGVGPALNDAVGGQVQVMYDNLPSSLALIQAGKLRALAVSSPKRLEALPDVPTFAELKLDDIDWMAFFGVVAPAGTPAGVVERLAAAVKQVLTMPEVREKLAGQQAILIGNAPAEFSAQIARELERFRRAVTAANIKVE